MGLLKKTRIIIAVLIILNVVLITVYGAFSNRINENNKKIENLAKDLDQQILKEQQYQSFKNILAQTEDQRDSLDSFFVLSEETVSFIQEIENLAAISSLETEITSVGSSDYINLDGETKSEKIEYLNLTINTFGNWQSNFYFLNLLENMPYKVSVNRLSLESKKDGSGQTLLWEGIFSIKVLKLK